ncbi:phosphatase domain-containing protein [uncultured Maribacter sp.]|uniref:App1 family protein n=1 Tax=uncultured Maribacter sp. TaxID=431308 RepID=UPI00261C5F62|nr:phosphatase domain-containing protein [uncultured Maribacter sp.]
MFKKDKLQIIPFKTYGTLTDLYLRGRALEDENIDLHKKGLWSVFVNTWKRFETDEIENAALKIELKNEVSLYVKTDSEGYFLVDEATENLSKNISKDGWLNYTIQYENPAAFKNEIVANNTFTGEMLVALPNTEYGVISDIDDTILHTGVASKFKWRAVFNTFFIHVMSRKALEGAADFYSQLHRGKLKNNCNPIFYVSNSPWNLYKYLDFFLKKNNFPKGAILLRDLRHLFDKTPKPKIPHKYHEIQNILDTYPKLSFILIGDCGEHDPDIYLDIVAKNPNRISAIYLRSVKNKKKMSRVTQLFKDYTEVDVLLVYNTNEAIRHAKDCGFI